MNSTFDEALERLRGTGTEVAGGIAPNHGPMGAEALVAMGHADVVVAWADRYRRNLDAMPTPTSPITLETWTQSLGTIERIADAESGQEGHESFLAFLCLCFSLDRCSNVATL